MKNWYFLNWKYTFFRAERVEHEEKLQNSQMENRQLTDKVRKLENEITSLKNKQRIDKEDQLDKRRLSVGNRQKLEDKWELETYFANK